MELEEFYHKYNSRLQNYLNHSWNMLSENDLEELEQEIWEEVLRYWNESNNVGWNWLRTIAYHRSIKHKNHLNQTIGLDDYFGEENEDGLVWEEQLGNNDLNVESWCIIIEEIENLSEEERIVLRDYLEGETENQLSKKHKISRYKVRRITMSKVNHPKRDFGFNKNDSGGLISKKIFFIFDKQTGLVKIMRSSDEKEALKNMESSEVEILRKIPAGRQGRLYKVKNRFNHCHGNWFYYDEEMLTFTLTKDMMR